jgi:hypothetical protein
VTTGRNRDDGRSYFAGFLLRHQRIGTRGHLTCSRRCFHFFSQYVVFTKTRWQLNKFLFNSHRVAITCGDGLCLAGSGQSAVVALEDRVAAPQPDLRMVEDQVAAVRPVRQVSVYSAFPCLVNVATCAGVPANELVTELKPTVGTKANSGSRPCSTSQICGQWKWPHSKTTRLAIADGTPPTLPKQLLCLSDSLAPKRLRGSFARSNGSAEAALPSSLQENIAN